MFALVVVKPHTRYTTDQFIRFMFSVQSVYGDRGNPNKAMACDHNKDKHPLFVH